MPKHVVILGGGPAGLSAGWGLAREGVEVDVLEKDSQVGGLCRSTRKDGFIFDLGGHRFITKDDLLLAEIEGLLEEELTVRPRKSAIWLQGRFFAYPLEMVDALRKMNPFVSLKCGLDFFLTKLGTYSKMSDISFENWIIKRFGKTMYRIYFGPYSHKLWGIPPGQISSAWAAQRISLLNLTDVLLRALGKKKDVPKTYARNFLYPKRGIGQISERISEEILKKDGRIHLGAMVKKIVLKNNRIEKVIYFQNNQEKEIQGDFVVSTIPLPEFVLSIEPAVENRYGTVARKMHFRALRFLHLILDIERASDNTWIYVPEEKYLFFRIQDRRNWSPTTVPEGKDALTLEIACFKGDSIWNSSDEEIFERCIKDLEELGLISRKTVVDYFTEKTEHAYPIYSLDYQNKVKTMYEVLSRIKDLIAIGRQGLFRYNNMDHSLKMGLLTAKHILHGYPRNKIWEIATENAIFDWQDPGYHDGNVVDKTIG